jgi:hypothetical protein
MVKTILILMLYTVFIAGLYLVTQTFTANALNEPTVTTTRNIDRELNNVCYTAIMTDGLQFAIATSCLSEGDQPPNFENYAYRKISKQELK